MTLDLICNNISRTKRMMAFLYNAEHRHSETQNITLGFQSCLVAGTETKCVHSRAPRAVTEEGAP